MIERFTDFVNKFLFLFIIFSFQNKILKLKDFITALSIFKIF